jgi:hypothetical protein
MPRLGHEKINNTRSRSLLDNLTGSCRLARQPGDKTSSLTPFHEASTSAAGVVTESGGRLVSAISTGGNIPALVGALKAAHDRRETLSSELAHVDSQQHSDAEYDQLESDLLAHFETSWKTILSRQVGPTRQILRKLFNGTRLPFKPMSESSESRYEFEGTASLDGLLTGRAKALVSPMGLSTF